MEYREDLTNEEFLANFKCCKTCSHWNKDVTLMNDYAYNTCLHWYKEQGNAAMIPWALYCDAYVGNFADKPGGPEHKLAPEGNKLVRVKQEAVR